MESLFWGASSSFPKAPIMISHLILCLSRSLSAEPSRGRDTRDKGVNTYLYEVRCPHPLLSLSREMQAHVYSDALDSSSTGQAQKTLDLLVHFFPLLFKREPSISSIEVLTEKKFFLSFPCVWAQREYGRRKREEASRGRHREALTVQLGV